MARRSAKPAVRYRDLVDPDVPVDANDERCPDCGASYEAFRSGTFTGETAGSLTSALIAAAGRDLSACDRANGAAHVGVSDALRMMRADKRAAWDAAHGPGRCVADESTFTGRVSLAAVLLGYPDTAAIMAGIPESIDDDEPNRTIWCALPVGDAPNPPSLASILLEQLAGDAGAADAFDDLDHVRSAGGIPSAWG